MLYILIVLIVIIFILLAYLFFTKRELRRIAKEIDVINNSDSNNLLNNEFVTREIALLTKKINPILAEIKRIEIDYSRKNTALMKMITNISHDLRTPLTSAIGYVNIIINSNLSEEEKMLELKTVESKLKKLESLINSFFDFSKIVSSNEALIIEKTNLNAVMENCIANYYEDFNKDNRKIILNASSNRIIIDSDKRLLIRIFDNLIGNSYKHSTSNLIINIEEQNGVKITFTNNLLNMDLDTDKMFDEFYTVDISRTKGNTGLGLAIAKEFTEQLKGKIYAQKGNNELIITIEF